MNQNKPNIDKSKSNSWIINLINVCKGVWKLLLLLSQKHTKFTKIQIWHENPKTGNLTIDLSLLFQDVNDEIPTFRSSSYVGEISENSPRATPILFLGGAGGNSGANTEEVLPEVFDHDSGTNGTFQLFLEGDQGIFDVCETSAFIFTWKKFKSFRRIVFMKNADFLRDIFL